MVCILLTFYFPGACRPGRLRERHKPDWNITAAITIKRASAMFKQKKFKQATLILVAVTVILILPNLTRLIG